MYRILWIIFLRFHVSLQNDSFYDFGPAFGDQLLPNLDDSFVGPIDISTTFPFFEKSFTSLFVNTNGLVSFDRSITAYVPQPFPLQNVITVAPFWADIDTRNGGKIYYREVSDYVTINRISNEIQRAFSAFYNFRVTWAFIATWDEVAAFGGTFRVNNTFQVVIATNGRYSFTLYNYAKLMWTLGSASGGTHAQAGFNAGDGKTFFVLPGSLTPNVINLPQSTNIDVPGKWIFRIDSQNITEGGCNTEGFLTVTPNRVFFIGGDSIVVKGPCFEFNSTYIMLFDNEIEIECTVIDSQTSICQVPFLRRIGRINLRMSKNGNFSFEGFILSRDVPTKPEIQGLEYIYELDNLGNATVSWGSMKNKNIQAGDECSVVFIYIDELTNTSQTIILKDNISCLIQSVDIDLSIIMQKESFLDYRKKNSKAGLIEKIKSGFTGLLKKIKSELTSIVSIGSSYLLMNFIYIGTDGNLDSDAQCKIWHSLQKDPNATLNGLPPCWRELTLDRNGNFPVAFGDFKEDPSCNPNNPKLCKLFHNGAKGCYRSISSFNGAGQQCCYSANNRLLVGPPGGGTLDVGHPDNPLNHYIKDVYPYFICCYYSNNCELYYEKRPSDDGSRWTPVVPGGGSGDPHFLTLDGLSYTFNGYGEYILLEIDEALLNVQIRMAPFINGQGVKSEGTVITGIVVQYESERIQIEINRFGSIDIFINNRLFEIETNDIQMLEFNEFYLYLSSTGYLLQFINGVLIEIKTTEDRNAFLVVSTLPSRFKNKTKGLLGIMDADISNDFYLPNGTIVEGLNATDDRDVFYNFGKFWQNNETNSLFAYPDGFSHSNYVNNSFIPKFVSDGITFSNTTLQALAIIECGNNLNCLFDVSTTGQLSIGALNKAFDETIVQIQESVQTNELACVPLSSIFNNGIVNITIIPSGYEYEFKCDLSYCLKGEKIIKCEKSNYNHPSPICLKCNSSHAVRHLFWLITSSLLLSLTTFK